MKNIIIDSNAWNFLFDSGISLSSPELSPYVFQITREISREMEELNGKAGKEALYKFFCDETIPLEDPLVYLGFDEPDIPEDEHRFGGFGVGGFGSVHQNDFLEKTLRQIKSSKRGIYYGNEADRLIGSRGFQNTYILTEDGSKSGPLKEASNIIPISHKQLMTVQEFRDHLDTYTST
ncbi:hypothetical protein [Enterobacter asburiae]|jgi:hypothetical protein|uniref:hypothetical protein n=1 Tax=Enterobacter asburiae TaxID=61645 RepID=UPI001C5AC11C|nr:hypothetical protein [Enterobacter asburiae]MBW4210784.1 hypothetical protein [Enterobacter asburiae]